MMVMPDLSAALGPGGPPDPGAGPDPYGGGAPPPDQALPPEQPAPDGGGGPFQTSMEALEAADEALHEFIRLDPDEADRAIAARCLGEVLKLKASNSQDASSGGLKSLQRALAGQAGGP